MHVITSGAAEPGAATSSTGPATAVRSRGESQTDDWRADAACVGADLEIFFPLGDQARHNELSARAKQVCASCPVMATCRAWALKVGPEFGIFGGLTAHERRLVREGRWNGEQPRRRAVAAKTERSTAA